MMAARRTDGSGPTTDAKATTAAMAAVAAVRRPARAIVKQREDRCGQKGDVEAGHGQDVIDARRGGTARRGRAGAPCDPRVAARRAARPRCRGRAAPHDFQRPPPGPDRPRRSGLIERHDPIRPPGGDDVNLLPREVRAVVEDTGVAKSGGLAQSQLRCEALARREGWRFAIDRRLQAPRSAGARPRAPRRRAIGCDQVPSAAALLPRSPRSERSRAGVGARCGRAATARGRRAALPAPRRRREGEWPPPRIDRIRRAPPRPRARRPTSPRPLARGPAGARATPPAKTRVRGARGIDSQRIAVMVGSRRRVAACDRVSRRPARARAGDRRRR